jgi:hypothetical protein
MAAQELLREDQALQEQTHLGADILEELVQVPRLLVELQTVALVAVAATLAEVELAA